MTVSAGRSPADTEEPLPRLERWLCAGAGPGKGSRAHLCSLDPFCLHSLRLQSVPPQGQAHGVKRAGDRARRGPSGGASTAQHRCLAEGRGEHAGSVEGAWAGRESGDALRSEVMHLHVSPCPPQEPRTRGPRHSQVALQGQRLLSKGTHLTEAEQAGGRSERVGAEPPVGEMTACTLGRQGEMGAERGRPCGPRRFPWRRTQHSAEDAKLASRAGSPLPHGVRTQALSLGWDMGLLTT